MGPLRSWLGVVSIFGVVWQMLVRGPTLLVSILHVEEVPLMRVRFWLLVSAFWLAVAACSESHDTAPVGSAAGGQGGGAAQAAGGRAATAGAGGKGGSPGGGQGSGCGACVGTNLFGFALPACCTTESKCGFDLTAVGLPCLEAHAAGNLDSQCPDQMLVGFTFKGCCRPDKTCGALDTMVGLGCASIPGVTTTECVP